METFNKLTKLVHSIPKLHEAGYKKGKEEGYKSGYDKGKEEGIAIGTSAFDQPLHIVENGEYTSPSGKRYNPITVNVPGEVYEDVPLSIVKSGVYETPQKTRYTPITVDIPKPTLNAPEISVNAADGTLYVYDAANGNFSTDYLLYIDGEQLGTFATKFVNVMEYKAIDGSETIQVKSTNSEFFNESEFSNALVWQEVCDGTPGLAYSGYNCTGVGTATETTVYVGSIVNGITITNISHSCFKQKSNYTVYLPDTIKVIGASAFYQANNIKVIFGANTITIGNQAFYASHGYNNILDFRKATKIPSIPGNMWYGGGNPEFAPTTIVPDSLYNDWIIATNWSAAASHIIRATDYEAQQGGTV